MAGDVGRVLFLLSFTLWFLTVRSSEILPSRGGCEQRELRRGAEKRFLSPRRELVGHGGSNGDHPRTEARATRHDMITNPVTTPPVTFPTTGPTPGIITVPASNPVTVLPGPPVTIPSTTPVVNPMPFPATNPVTTPITVPATIPAPPPPGVLPINPVTTPTLPLPPPLTNPVTTYPFPPPSTIPFAPGIGTVPVTVPVAPAVAGQTWCVAKIGALDAALQIALDYACGIGGADCLAIQQTGGCYNPNTLRDHASYAFNSYYQKNPSPLSCDFGGTAMLVNTNPSTAICTYPSTSSAAPVFNTYNPTASTPNNPTGTPINPTGTGTVFGSNNPIGSANPTSHQMAIVNYKLTAV
ncbi:hypothetical protein Taro_031289 [Colocasia esculenta]|uniref:X8 domain-containing protein n=1 Tax=Colocasia esculenta TaxID=4460 RepID=A0A843VRH8_COLES|nr:hypothetical protein [Colocasia esculenta]